jgi:hypothetical protein
LLVALIKKKKFFRKFSGNNFELRKAVSRIEWKKKRKVFSCDENH